MTFSTWIKIAAGITLAIIAYSVLSRSNFTQTFGVPVDDPNIRYEVRKISTNWTVINTPHGYKVRVKLLTPDLWWQTKSGNGEIQNHMPVNHPAYRSSTSPNHSLLYVRITSDQPPSAEAEIPTGDLEIEQTPE